MRRRSNAREGARSVSASRMKDDILTQTCENILRTNGRTDT